MYNVKHSAPEIFMTIKGHFLNKAHNLYGFSITYDVPFKLKYILIIRSYIYYMPDALRPDSHVKISYVPMPRTPMGMNRTSFR